VNQHLDNKPVKSWYPSVFFFDLKKGMTVWEIFGTEMFICIHKARVLVLRNDIWSQSTKQKYTGSR